MQGSRGFCGVGRTWFGNYRHRFPRNPLYKTPVAVSSRTIDPTMI
jgi:hypothetical protein